MKIHLISDLHCDFSKYTQEFPDCDVVVIAGDIGEDPLHLIDICNYNPMHKIIFVPGNHDFYGSSVEQRMQTFYEIQTEICKNLIVLQNEFVEVNGVLFYGCTLWSGLDAYAGYAHKLKSWYEYNIADTRYITSWSADLMIQEHFYSHYKMTEFFQRNKGKKKVVITHFAPSLKSVHESYSGSVPFNSYWCNGFSDDFISNADLWLHGHVHNSFDYNVNEYSEKQCRVVCNPRGYITSYGEENYNFNPNLILEI